MDYYQYNDPGGNIRTGVLEHTYAEQDWSAMENQLREKYPAADEAEIARMLQEIQTSLIGDACQSYAFSALGYTPRHQELPGSQASL